MKISFFTNKISPKSSKVDFMDFAKQNLQKDFDKQSSQNLIVFFSGFASLPSHFCKFADKNFMQDFDMIMAYDYRDFGEYQSQIKDIINASKNYKNVYLIAWSMGVFVASVCLGEFVLQADNKRDKIFAKKVAINGTNIGIDRLLGIPPKVFAYTAKNIQPQAFRNALFEAEMQGEHLQDFMRDITLQFSLDFALPRVENLQNELESLQIFTKNLAQNRLQDFRQDFVNHFLWDKAIISRVDKVFPPQACEAFFAQNPHKNHTKITYTDAPHFAFVGFKNWHEIIE